MTDPKLGSYAVAALKKTITRTIAPARRFQPGAASPHLIPPLWLDLQVCCAAVQPVLQDKSRGSSPADPRVTTGPDEGIG